MNRDLFSLEGRVAYDVRFELFNRRELVQISRLQQIRFHIPRKKIFGSSVKLESGDVICRRLLNRCLFACRKAGLQLAGN